MKPIKPSGLDDRQETLKYFDDIDLKTPFETLGVNYLEQLRATLNYKILNLPVIDYSTKFDSERYILVIQASSKEAIDLDIFAKLKKPENGTGVGFLAKNDNKKYLSWLGDDRESGSEQILVNVSSVLEDFPDINSIEINTMAKVVKPKDIDRYISVTEHFDHTITFSVFLYAMTSYVVLPSNKINVTNGRLISKQENVLEVVNGWGSNSITVALTKDSEDKLILSTEKNDNYGFDYNYRNEAYSDIPCNYIIFKIPNVRKEHKRLVMKYRYIDYLGQTNGSLFHSNWNGRDIIFQYEDDGVSISGHINIQNFQRQNPKLDTIEIDIKTAWHYFYEEDLEEDSNDFTINVEVYKIDEFSYYGNLEINEESKLFEKSIEHTTLSKFDYEEEIDGDNLIRISIPTGTTNVDEIKIDKPTN